MAIGIYVVLFFLIVFLGESRFKGPFVRGVPIWNWVVVATSPIGAFLTYYASRELLNDSPPWDLLVGTVGAILYIPGMYLMFVVDARKSLKSGHMEFSLNKGVVRIDKVGEPLPEYIATQVIKNKTKLQIPLADCPKFHLLRTCVDRLYGKSILTELCFRSACAYQSESFILNVLELSEYQSVHDEPAIAEAFVTEIYAGTIEPINNIKIPVSVK